MSIHTRRKFIQLATAAGISSYFLGFDRSFANSNPATNDSYADLILHNGNIATQDNLRPFVSAIAIKNGRFIAVGDDDEVIASRNNLRGDRTQVINLQKRTVIPGLNDSHTHLIRGGLNYNLELRWDGVPSLADGLRMLREQVDRTPPNHWVRVVGGFTEFQFAEKRLPTLDELNRIAPNTPVFILHLYDRALLNKAALRALNITKDTPEPPGSLIERDSNGNPTGLLLAKPNALLLYSTLARAPKLPYEFQLNSSRQFMWELNRLGITSVVDAGGGYHKYPDDYKVIEELHQRGELTVRIAYNLFPQQPKEELTDFNRWTNSIQLHQGDEFYQVNGVGETLVFSASDFEDFLQPRPDLTASMEEDLKPTVKLLVEKGWNFRMHATYDESISRFLDVFEEVDREVPLSRVRWFFDHAETITDRNLERVKALGGGIAIQHRMAYQGEYFINRYGEQAASQTPPIQRMLEMGIPVGGGTDGTRIASYNPWVALYWLVAGKTLGGTSLYSETNRLSRMEALRLYTVGSSWFSSEDGKKGAIVPGQFADLAVLSDDYFSIPEDEIKHLQSVLTIVGGKPVYATAEFRNLAPPPLPISPEWSPVARFGGYANSSENARSLMSLKAQGLQAHNPGHIGCCSHLSRCKTSLSSAGSLSGFWGGGCDCFLV